MASPSPFLFLKERIQYWGQSNDSDPNILRIGITPFRHVYFLYMLVKHPYLTKDITNSVFWRLYSVALGYNQRLFYLELASRW